MSGAPDASPASHSQEIRAWAAMAARAADDTLGVDTVMIDVADVLSITDFFVITGGANRRQVRALVDEIERRLGEAGGPKPIRVEGNEERSPWVLLDYGTFVVHLFEGDARRTYDLERLWSDRPTVDFARV